MTKGQRAMAVAKIYPDTEQGKRKTSLETKQVGVSKTNLSFARTVLQYAPDLAAGVLAGSPRFPTSGTSRIGSGGSQAREGLALPAPPWFHRSVSNRGRR